jgi:hypothetical protein
MEQYEPRMEYFFLKKKKNNSAGMCYISFNFHVRILSLCTNFV